MTNLSEFTFLSSDGKTQLHGMLWEPEGVASALYCRSVTAWPSTSPGTTALPGR